MPHIVADVLSLLQHIKLSTEESEHDRLSFCLCCGKAGLWRWGSYPRKAARTHPPGESLNPILIQRYYCPTCRRTSSVLPECIPPHRWYLWATQQMALMLSLLGRSVRSIAKEISPSRQTITRWIGHFRAQFRQHKDVLCNRIPDFGRTIGFEDFWAKILLVMPLSKAMRLCHVAGVFIP